MSMQIRKVSVLILLCILVAAALLGCGANKKAYTVDAGGETLTVDPQECKIYHGSDVYSYTVSGSGERIRYQITYPNGGHYTWEQNGGTVSGGWSEDYREDLYISGEVLVEAIASQKAQKSPGKLFFVGLLLVVIGVFPVFWPKKAWFLDTGWRFKNAEPSDATIFLTRLGGGILIVVGIVFFFV